MTVAAWIAKLIRTTEFDIYQIIYIQKTLSVAWESEALTLPEYTRLSAEYLAKFGEAEIK